MTYGTVADLITYHAARGRTIVNEAATTQALQRASDYVRTRYVKRLGLDADNEDVIEATYIAAGYDLTTPGFWQKTFTPSEQKVLTKVEDIQWTVTGSNRGADDALPVSPAIEALFAGRVGQSFGMLVV